jgi:hypothetical protein
MSAPQPPREPHAQLRHRRDRLAQQVAELQWYLGGLVYEMAIRDHYRLDVLTRRAAILQERDAELAEVERVLHMQESSVAGDCGSCGAVRSRGAVFCWQCGAQLMERQATPAGRADTSTDGGSMDSGSTDGGSMESGSTGGRSTGATGATGDAEAKTVEIDFHELGRPVQITR